MSTTVTYKGNTLTTVTNETRTLTTQGKYLEDNITLVDITSGGSGSGAVWQDQYGYVHLSDEGDIDLQTKTVSPTESAQTVLADAGYYALDRVNVNAIPSNYVGTGVTQRTSSDLTASGATVTAPSGYYASNATKTITSGSATPASTISATGATVSTGTNTLTLSKSVSNTPTVSAGYISSGTSGSSSVSLTASVNTRSSSDLTASGATVTAPSGYYASSATKTVASGTEGTPTATKGAVSNHAIAVTPSVTNTAGYITGSTKTGTAVSVSASELVSGTKSISANGTGIDVTNFASVDVAVPSSTPTLITKSITANGTYNASSDSADGYSSVTVNVSGGGGGEPAKKKQINFIDYDGTILHSYTKSEWQSVSTLPSNPSHSGLTAQGWNWTKAQIDAQLTAVPDGDVWVGQMYITTSGDTEIDVSFVDSTRLSPYLSCAVNGTITIDWGDNSTSTVTGTSLTTRISTQHVYASAGDYTITIQVESGSWAFYGTSTYTLLNKNSNAANANRVYSNCVQNVRIGANTSIDSYAFAYCYSLASVTIPSGVTSIGTYAFYYCYSLASVTIPNNVTSIGTYTFSYCYSLANVTIPSGVTSIGNSAFNNCYPLASVTIPSGVTSIGSSAFYNCYSLASVIIPSDITSIGNSAFGYCYSLANVTIPSDVTSIGNSAFNSCYGMAEYHIKPTTPPTLGTTVFSNIQSDCVIYVPSASLTTYKGASNWSDYASYMVGE